jgi:glutaconate CoA-transferase subunit B
MSSTHYSRDELMTIAAARKLKNGAVCFVGIGIPSIAANLARITHAPELVLIYESGVVGAKPHVLPLSIGDGDLADTADFVVSVPEIFRYWLQGGRIDVGFLGGAQVDKRGNINTTMIGGSYRAPSVRLPGAGGAPEIASASKEVWIILKHSQRSFVDRLDFVTTGGIGQSVNDTPQHMSATSGYVCPRGRGPTTIISDLGVLIPHPETREFMLTAIHPGVTRNEVLSATGWKLEIASTVDETPSPTDSELEALRELHLRTALAHDPIRSRF